MDGQKATTGGRRSAGGAGALSWALCVATLDRIEILEACLRCVLGQTRRPSEIVIVDASAAWRAHAQRARSIVDGSVPLVYVAARRPSLTVQRNQALELARSDILFLIDDDSLMHPDCAAAILAVYEADGEDAIAAVGASEVAEVPAASGLGEAAGAAADAAALASRRHARAGRIPGRGRALAGTALGRWVRDEVFLDLAERHFVPYDAHRSRAPVRVPEGVEATPRPHIGGFALTVRRAVAAAEPFDPHLLAYCPGEDLDATYRYGRHGAVVVAHKAHLHHRAVAASRLKRYRVSQLGSLNSAFFTAQHSDARARHIAQYYVLGLRRLLAELLKDVLRGRPSLPQLRGTAAGLVRSVAVFTRPRAELGPWYVTLQQRLLGLAAPGAGSGPASSTAPPTTGTPS